jgi:hypothetical protein
MREFSRSDTLGAMSRSLSVLLSIIITGCGDSFVEGLEFMPSTETATTGEPSQGHSSHGDAGDACEGISTTDDEEMWTDDASPLPEVLEFTVEPPLLAAAGLVNISLTFSPQVTEARLFELYNDEPRELATFSPEGSPAPFTHDYAITGYGVNGAHELYVQAFDAQGVIAQETSTFHVALPLGGTQVWHYVDEEDPSTLFSHGEDLVVHGEGVILVGYAYIDLNYHLVARRYTSEHELDWSYVSDDPVIATAVTIDAESNVILTGHTVGATPRVWLHKLDPEGAPLWDAPHEGPINTIGLDVTTDAQGQIYLAGVWTTVDLNNPNNREDNAMLWVLEPEHGELVNAAKYDNNEDFEMADDRATGVIVREDGRVLVSGYTVAADENDAQVPLALVFEYTPFKLTPLWTAVEELWYASVVHGIVDDGGGGVVLAGWTQAELNAPRKLYARRLDDEFVPSWRYPGYPFETLPGEALTIDRDPAGRFIVGASLDGPQDREAHIFVAEHHGGAGWSFTHKNPLIEESAIKGVATDRFGYVYYTGAEFVDDTPRLFFGKLNP